MQLKKKCTGKCIAHVIALGVRKLAVSGYRPKYVVDIRAIGLQNKNPEFYVNEMYSRRNIITSNVKSQKIGYGLWVSYAN